MKPQGTGRLLRRICKLHYYRDIYLHHFAWFVHRNYRIRSLSYEQMTNKVCQIVKFYFFGIMLNGRCLVWGNVCISFANLVWFLIYHFTLEFSHSLPLIQLLPPNADKDRKHEWAETHCLYLFMFLSDSYSVICSLNHHSSSSSSKKKKRLSLLLPMFCIC